MTITIEVCIDNIESLTTVMQAGANRIELCSALSLGGLTPCAGLIKKAVELSTIPIYAMVRPRAGDFIFNQSEIDIMVDDILLMKEFGVNGVVIGALTAEGDIDLKALKRLVVAANGLGVTFHRAFDLCRQPQQALEVLIEQGCERVLTSGLQTTAEAGISTIADLVRQAKQRISIMPGAGVNAANAVNIVKLAGVMELHLSGKTTRPSLMLHQQDSGVSMGNNVANDLFIDVTSFDKVRAVVELFSGLSSTS